jgi:hypothetical protein
MLAYRASTRYPTPEFFIVIWDSLTSLLHLNCKLPSITAICAVHSVWTETICSGVSIPVTTDSGSPSTARSCSHISQAIFNYTNGFVVNSRTPKSIEFHSHTFSCSPIPLRNRTSGFPIHTALRSIIQIFSELRCGLKASSTLHQR